MSKDENIFSTIPKLNYTETAPVTDIHAFETVVKSRRSVRVFTNEAVPETVVQSCLDLALLAPNSSNLQPWEFHWVRNTEKKDQLVKACMSQPAAKTAAEIIVAVGRTSTWKKNARDMLKLFEKQSTPAPKAALSYYKKLVPLAYRQGPFSIIGFLRRIFLFIAGIQRAVPREPVSHAQMKTWAAKSTALACQNLMLAFRAYGYDSCPMEGLDSTRVRKILGLPRDAIVVMAISAGKRAENGVYGPQLRFEKERAIIIHS